MLSINLCDHIYKVPNNVKYSVLCMTIVGYYYHLVNVISLNLSQSNHMKQLTLYLEWKQTMKSLPFSIVKVIGLNFLRHQNGISIAICVNFQTHLFKGLSLFPVQIYCVH